MAKKKQLLDPLERVEKLLVKTLVVQLYLSGSTMDEIKKNMHMDKGAVVEMLKGVKKPK